MAKSIVPKGLYRLIEAGHLARQAVLAPLADRGLSPGDDAILLALDTAEGLPDTALMDLTGLDSTQLVARLDRLATRDIVERAAVGPEMVTGARLTGKGIRMRDVLRRHWDTLNDELIGALPAKQRRELKRALDKMIAELSG